MSQLKTNSITNIGNTGDANIVLGDSGDTQVQSLNSGPLSGFRNQIINGGTYIWQRGTSAGPVAGGGYSADHVFISDGVTWTRAPSASFAPGLEFGLRFSGGANCYAAFPVELLRVGYPNQFANGTQWTFSYYADRGTDHSPRVYFSDGPVPANAVDVFPTAAPTSLGGNRYSVTFTVASAPAGSNTCLVARVLNTTGAQLEITGIQLEPGPVATPFEHRPIGTELALCQRYFEASGTPGSSRVARWIAISDGNGVAPTFRSGTVMFFQTAKRVTPTMTYFSYNGTSGAVSATSGSSTTNIDGTNLAAHATKYGTQLRRPSITTLGSISQYWGDFYADAEL